MIYFNKHIDSSDTECVTVGIKFPTSQGIVGVVSTITAAEFYAMVESLKTAPVAYTI